MVAGLAIGAVLGVDLGGCTSKASGGGGTGGGAGGGGAGGNGIAGMGGNGGAHATVTVSAALNPKIDILFMIDNSPSMLPLQTKFIAAIPAFMNVLKMVPGAAGPNPGLPDVHVAVVSSDTGPGEFDLPALHCPFGGDQGRFQSVPRGTCTASPFKDANQHFLAASMNQTITNYTGDIADALGCIAALGDQGCDFEGQLKSVRLALDPLNPPQDNVGFLRPDAILAVILFTNEDDCSVPDISTLFDPTAPAVATLGPAKSFRCNEYGHLCNVGGTLAPPPKTGTVSNLQGCVSNDTPTGKLTILGDEIAFLKTLKDDPNQVFVTAITGLATPYSLAPDAAGDQSVVHSCTQGTMEYADPAVRIQQWVQAFGNHGLSETICASSFAPAMQQTADELAKLLVPPCLPSNLVDTDLNTPGLQPNCGVTDSYVNAQNKNFSTILQSCIATGDTPPCWDVVPGTTLCPSGLAPRIHRDPTMQLPNGLSTTFSCTECVAGQINPGCP
jgi:hypothetical protein